MSRVEARPCVPFLPWFLSLSGPWGDPEPAGRAARHEARDGVETLSASCKYVLRDLGHCDAAASLCEVRWSAAHTQIACSVEDNKPRSLRCLLMVDPVPLSRGTRKTPRTSKSRYEQSSSVRQAAYPIAQHCKSPKCLGPFTVPRVNNRRYRSVDRVLGSQQQCGHATS